MERVRLHLLGPFELFVDGALVEVPRSRVRDALTILAMRSPDVVPHDSLIDDLWADEAPKHPRAALRVVLSRARSALGDAADALATTPIGIRLYAATDVDDFFSAELDADDSTVFVNALALWRGEPHASVLPTAGMSAHAQRLTDRRRRLTIRLGETLLSEGRAGSAVDLLSAESRGHATDEGLARLHAAALAGDGRKGDAIRVLEETRTALRAELGVDPTPAFDEIERLVLNDAVDLSDVPVTASAPEGATPFVGRLEEISVLLDPQVRRVVLRGEAGIGKTRLLTETAKSLEARGGPVIRVACPNLPVRAMQTLADLLGALPTDGSTMAPETAVALRRIDRSLADDPGDVIVAPIRREGLVSLVADHIVGRVAGTNATIIIDDAHWIDRGSAEVIHDLLHTDIRIIAAMWPTAEASALSFDGVDTTFIELAGLDANHTESLIASGLGRQAGSDLAASIHEKSGGNPFFVELLVSLAAEGALRPADELPMTALVAVQSRIDRLSGPARQTLLQASVLGADVDLSLLRLVRPSMDRDLAEAVAERLVEVDVERNSARFVHALVAQGAYELLSEGQRADLHDQFAVALADSPGRAIEFSGHATGAEIHDPHRCVEAHLAAASAHLQALSDAEAVSEARRARRALDRWQIRDVALEGRAGVIEGRALRWSDGAASARALIRAAEIARSSGNTSLLIEATLALCERGRNTVAGAVDEVAAHAVDELLERDDLATEQRARLLAGSSLLFAVSTADDEVRRRFADAVTLARQTKDEQLEAEILLETDFGLSHPLDFDQRVLAAKRLGVLAGDNPDLRWEAAWLQFGTAVRTADCGEAVAAYEAMRSGLDKVLQRPRQFGMAIVETVVAQLAGELDEAEAWAKVALQEGLRRYPESWAMNAYGALLLGIRRTSGQVGELLETFTAILETNPNYPTWGVCVAYAALDAGDEELAAQTFASLTGDGFEVLVRDGSWTSAIGVLAEVAAGLGQKEEALALHELLLPFGGQLLWSGVSPYGPAADSLALVLDSVGRADEAAEHRRVGVELRTRLEPLAELRRRPPTPN